LLWITSKNTAICGKIEDPDGVGEVGDPVYGAMMTITIKVKDYRLFFDKILLSTGGSIGGMFLLVKGYLTLS
jgi:hypothetical protein